MNKAVLDQFEILDNKKLVEITGSGYGAQCVIGTIGGTILGGAFFGPVGASAGVAIASTAFCYGTAN